MTRLQRLTPMLAVASLERTIAFYCDQLGFQCVSKFGEPEAVWCHLKHDGVELMFNRPPAAVTDLRVTVYGMKEFELREPDGYWLWFGQPTTEPPAVGE